jgi:hypothetical protein
MSSNSNGEVSDRFFDKHEYQTLTPEHKNKLRLKRLKRGHIRNGQSSRDGKSHPKGSQSSTIKQLQRTISALNSRFDKLGVPSEDEDECESEEETESPNRSNSAFNVKQRRKERNTSEI